MNHPRTPTRPTRCKIPLPAIVSLSLALAPAGVHAAPGAALLPPSERQSLGPAPAGAPEAPAERPRDPAASLGLLRTAGALGVVLALIGALAVGAKRLARTGGGLGAALGPGGPSPAGVLEILGRYPLGRGLTLVLLRVDRRVLLLSQSGGGGLRRGGGPTLTTLCELTDAEDVASLLLRVRDEAGESIARRFAELLENQHAEHDEREAAWEEGVSVAAWPAGSPVGGPDHDGAREPSAPGRARHSWEALA